MSGPGLSYDVSGVKESFFKPMVSLRMSMHVRVGALTGHCPSHFSADALH